MIPNPVQVEYVKATYHLVKGLPNEFKKAYQCSVHSLDNYEAAKHWWRRNDEFKVSSSLSPGGAGGTAYLLSRYTSKPRASENTSSSSI